ncbi:MAG TPA: hypothetical protein PLV41_03855 [Miltoncostaeales bacterium]|jgi:hypothetical protein|nr:hypothetical protein [Miltoncostaeales bacterium]
MIVRILHDGQYRIADADVAAIQALDEHVEEAVAGSDDQAFVAALERLVDGVRHHGVRLADDELIASDAVVPDADTTLTEAKALLSEEGLIPD